MSTVSHADATTASSTFLDPTELAEEPTTEPSAFSGEGSQEHSGSFDWEESHAPETLEPETLAPTATTALAPTAAPSATPNATAVPTTNKSSGGGGSGAVVSVTIVIIAVLIVLGVVVYIRRRRRNRRFIDSKFRTDPNHGTPTVSIELPPPPPSSRLSYDPSQSQLNHNQRLSVFSNNGRVGGGASLFNTNAPVVSPNLAPSRLPQASSSSSSAFRPDMSTTYRLVDPSPSHVAPTPMLQASQPRTPLGAAARQQYQPDYGQYKPQYQTKSSDGAMVTSSTTVSSSLQSQGTNGLTRDTTVSVASTIQGFHDSMCDDLFQYGDGLGRERAVSRDRARSRGNSSASASGAPGTRPKKPSIVLEIDELMPLPVLAAPSPYSTPTSKKTLSIAEMRGAGKRAPPPPPPPQAPASPFVVMPPPSPTLSETEPFNPLMMTSVRLHEARSSEDVVGNHGMVAKFSSSASSAAASAGSAGSASFESVSSLTSAFSASSSSTHLHSSHNGRIFEKPMDTAIQRLSDVSSVSSETSTVRAGSLIELKQVVETEHPDGKAKEIEI